VDVTSIRELFAYNQWANERTLAAASLLNGGDFTRNLGSSFSSVRDTLAHIMASEWLWLERWNGRSPKALLPATDFPTPDAIAQRWKEIQRVQNTFLTSIAPERLRAIVSYTNLRGQTYAYLLWRQMAHVVNHSSYHRGQVTTLLRQLEAAPVPTDLLIYYDEMGD
jgi:uncharacterized damage-inducible protein DinB